MAAAKSTWDSEGGATDQRRTHGQPVTGLLVPPGALEALGIAPGLVPQGRLPAIAAGQPCATVQQPVRCYSHRRRPTPRTLFIMG